MRSAVSIVATAFGVFAGLGSIEHGVFEILQGDVRPEGIMISSMGPPCVPEEIWNACEPAMTIIPNFLVTGILAILLGSIAVAWSLFFIQRRHGGLILMLLSLAMLLFGGGIFPPVIGIIGGLVGTRINGALTWWRGRRNSTLLRLLALLWPWTLVLFFVLLLGQWIVGAISNEFMTQLMVPNLILVLLLLVLAPLSALAHDARASDS
jgi:hypothetical protein